MAAVVLVLAGMVLYQERILQRGTTVILQTRPVDPRDLFRGEYVTLRYAIERHELLEATVSGQPEGARVHVRLEPDARGVAHVAWAQLQRPDMSGGLWITGEKDGDGARFPSIEQYYVPEGAGQPIERMGRNLNVRVVLHNGSARVVELLDAELQALNPAGIRTER